jgi:hypothetical protein
VLLVAAVLSALDWVTQVLPNCTGTLMAPAQSSLAGVRGASVMHSVKEAPAPMGMVAAVE